MASTERSPVDLVRRFPGISVLAVGDAMLDTYLEGDATRLCKEGPVPVLEKSAEAHAPGGGANAAANLRALGASVRYVGLVGLDRTAEELRQALNERGIDPSGLVVDEQCSTMRKTRVIANGQYVVRFDDGDCRGCGAAAERRMIDQIESAFPGVDVVLVSDYGYGAVSDRVIAHVSMRARRRSLVLAVDAKDPRRFVSAGATFIAPNFAEACRAVNPAATPQRYPSIRDAERIARQLQTLIDAENIAVTLAGDGVMLVDRSGRAAHVPARAVPHAGDVGAGDSFLAAASLALGAGGTPAQAVRIGIDAAGLAVTKQRTSVVEHRELLRRVSLDDRVPEHSLKSLAAIVDAERFNGKTIVFTNGVFDILHAGHVDLLQRAKSLGDVLVVGINSDASTRRLKGDTRPINRERDRLALVSALEPVDYAVIFDQDTPADVIATLRPHIHVKGGDYTPESLPEATAVYAAGGRIVILPLVDGRSTTNVIHRIAALAVDGAFGAVQ